MRVRRRGIGVEESAATMPSISLVTRDDAIERLSSERAADRQSPADFLASIRGLENVGLLEPGLVRSESDVLTLALEGVRARYLFGAREIIIIANGAATSDTDANTALAHEMVHVLQDQTHDLVGLSAVVPATSDAQVGLASLVEGEAILYELEMAAAYRGRTLAALDFDRLVRVGDDLTRELGSPAVNAELIFPYTYGAAFVAERRRASGLAAIDALYASPPTDTLQILETGGPMRGPIADTPAALDGYVLVHEDVEGAWMMAATLADLRDDSRALTTVGNLWRGDRLCIYRETDGDGVVSEWVIRARDVSAADDLAEAFASWQPPTGELALRVADRALHIVVSDAPSDAVSWLDRGNGAQ